MSTPFHLGLDRMPVLVTGAASGIGCATALLIADCGAHVAIVDRDAAGATAVADRINAAGGRAVAIVADAGCDEDIRAAVVQAEASLGVIRVLVNNVGIGERR